MSLSTTLLLVEDDSAYALFVSRMLSRATPPHRVVHAPTLTSALTFVAAHTFDAILLDLGLPDSSGTETIRAFTSRHPSLPVVVLTSNDDESLVSDALQAGAQDYVRKDEADPALLSRSVRYAIERQAVARALRDSESRYRLLFESNPQPMWVYEGETTRFLAVNDAAVRSYGYSREEFLDLTVADLRDDRPPAVLQRTVSGPRHTDHGLERFRRKDGTRIIAQVTTHALALDDRPARLAMAQDVTERVRADERLRFLNEASALLNSADLEGTLQGVVSLAVAAIACGAGVMLVDHERRLTHLFMAHRNAAVEQATAAEANRFREERNSLPDALREVLASGQPHLAHDIPGEHRVRYVGPALAAESFCRSVVIVPLATIGEPFGLLMLTSSGNERLYDWQDLSTADDLGRRLALTIENARLVREARELFEANLTGNFVAAASGEILACNRAFVDMLRFAGETAVGTDIRRLFASETGWRDLMAQLEHEERLAPIEIEFRTADRRSMDVLLSAVAVFDERRTLSRVRGQLFDISTHKRLEAQLSHAQKMEAVGRLAGGIAHDFNNLLTIIGGQGERIRQGLAIDSDLLRSADAVVQATLRAARLTQQLLAFSRRQVLAPRVLSVNALVENVHGMLERLIGEDILCVVTLGSPVGHVRADAGLLEQALVNLAVNARDAMPRGGRLSIATSEVFLDEAHGQGVVPIRPGRYVRIAVTDTGFGMDEETKGRAFEPFFTTKEVGRGTGLGLSMVYGVVKQSDGYIFVDSEPGMGSTFRLYLPVVEEPLELPVASAPVAAAMGGSETILLVEDEDGVRELLQEILRMQGYRVLSASRGAEALDVSEQFDGEIHLLVTDVVMPHMSGRELATRLSRQRPRTGVLYLSGYTDDAIANHGSLEPGSAFLQKPFATADLTRKIREILDSPPAPARA